MCDSQTHPDYCPAQATDVSGIASTYSLDTGDSNLMDGLREAHICGTYGTSYDPSMDVNTIKTNRTISGNDDAFNASWGAGFTWFSQNPDKSRPNKPI